MKMVKSLLLGAAAGLVAMAAAYAADLPYKAGGQTFQSSYMAHSKNMQFGFADLGTYHVWDIASVQDRTATGGNVHGLISKQMLGADNGARNIGANYVDNMLGAADAKTKPVRNVGLPIIGTNWVNFKTS